jgi:hypothetical protein
MPLTVGFLLGGCPNGDHWMFQMARQIEPSELHGATNQTCALAWRDQMLHCERLGAQGSA